jgi:serine/threonine protein phosphatase PrpC
LLRVAEHFEKSDTGLQRRANEDSYFVRAPLFVVADGMGGAQAGEVASGLAAETFSRGLADGGTPEQRLEERVREANRAIHERQQGDRSLQGMGTTITAAYLDGDELALAHVGDSRAYLQRDGELTRLTRDHTLVEELVRRGELTEQEAAEHPQRSIITRALGPEEDVEIDLHTHRVRAGDVLLLCSDGLTGMIDEAEVQEILSGAGSLGDAGRALVSAANAAGGRDNITVVLFRLEEVGAGATGPPSLPPTATTEPATRASRPRVVPPRGSKERAEAPLPRRVKLLAATAAVLIVVGVLGIAGWLASRAVFFVGTNDAGIVTVYRGIPWELPAGIELYEQWYVSGVPASAMSAGERERLLDHRLRSRDDASDLIAELELGTLDR